MLPGWATEERGIYAIYPGYRFIPAKMRAYVDHFAARLRDSDVSRARHYGEFFAVRNRGESLPAVVAAPKRYACALIFGVFHTMRPVVVALSFLLVNGAAEAADKPSYPPAERGTVVDDYHGTKVEDPYRWMEDIDSPQTRAWVEAEARLSSDYLAKIPVRDRIVERMRKIWNFERWSAPEKYGKHWFYSHNDGLQSQAVVFVTDDPKSAGKVLLDPNTLSADGTVALREHAISDDGRYYAYAVSDAGSDWQIWRVRDVASGQDLPDQLKWSKAAPAGARTAPASTTPCTTRPRTANCSRPPTSTRSCTSTNSARRSRPIP